MILMIGDLEWLLRDFPGVPHGGLTVRGVHYELLRKVICAGEWVVPEIPGDVAKGCYCHLLQRGIEKCAAPANQVFGLLLTAELSEMQRLPLDILELFARYEGLAERVAEESAEQIPDQLSEYVRGNLFGSLRALDVNHAFEMRAWHGRDLLSEEMQRILRLSLPLMDHRERCAIVAEETESNDRLHWILVKAYSIAQRIRTNNKSKMRKNVITDRHHAIYVKDKWTLPKVYSNMLACFLHSHGRKELPLYFTKCRS